MRDVFLSHSSRDGDHAQALCSLLEQAGVTVWIAPRDIPPGSDYTTSVMEGVRGCEAVVALVSREFQTSPYTHREIERAVSLRVGVVPVRLDDAPLSGWAELLLSPCQWLDGPPVTGEPDWAATSQRLVAAIRNLPPPPPPRRRRRRAGLAIAGTVAVVGAAGGLALRSRVTPPPAPSLIVGWVDGLNTRAVNADTEAVTQGADLTIKVDDPHPELDEYLVWISGERVEITAPNAWRDALAGRRQAEAGESNTYIVVRVPKGAWTDGAREALARDLSAALARQGDRAVRVPDLPLGRQFVWEETGWKWAFAGSGRPGGLPPTIEEERSLTSWADTVKSTLKAHIPTGASFAGRTFRVEPR